MALTDVSSPLPHPTRHLVTPLLSELLLALQRQGTQESEYVRSTCVLEAGGLDHIGTVEPYSLTVSACSPISELY